MTLHEVYLTECPHILLFTEPVPVTGDEVLCTKCGSARIVSKAPPSYRVRCVSCPTGSSHRAALESAKRAARRHIGRHPTHVVQIKDGKTLIDTWNEPQETLTGT